MTAWIITTSGHVRPSEGNRDPVAYWCEEGAERWTAGEIEKPREAKTKRRERKDQPRLIKDREGE